MAIIPPKPTTGDFQNERAPSGTHQAVCQSVHDIGIQETTFNGETKKKHKVVVIWEINERIAEGKFKGERFVLSKRYTLSLHEKSTLRHDLASWRGRDFTDEELGTFDLEKLIGVNCLLSVVETKKGDKTYTNIAGVMKLPKGMPTIAPELPVDHKYAWIEKIKGAVHGSTEAEHPQTRVTPTTSEEASALANAGDPHDSLAGSSAENASGNFDDVPF